MAKSVLVVDDEPHIQDLLRINLKKNGYNPVCCSSGEEALACMTGFRPDLILLDVMMPGMDGLETCRCIRQDLRLQQIPIIMLTAKSEESDKVIGLGMGADDYITKPFGLRELLARINVCLRRVSQSGVQGIMTVGDIQIDPEAHLAFCGGKSVDLTLTEFNILLQLCQRAGRVIPRDELVDLGDGNSAIEAGSISVHILNLRRKIGDERIQTVRGVGYRLLV